MNVEYMDNNIYSNLKDIYIKQDNKTMKIFYGANGDLYFDSFGERNKDSNGIYSVNFYIDKNDEIYSNFEELVNNILDCNIFELDDLNYDKKSDQNLKNSSNYNALVCDNVITWYSDEIYDERANLLKIEKTDNGILLTFFDNPDDPLFGFGIRICNSGSKYDPFNICFMNFYNKLQEFYKTCNGDKIKKLIH